MSRESLPDHSGSVSLLALRADLLATLHPAAGHTEPYDIWTCRECGVTTGLVVVVPHSGAWGHAVRPLCIAHYPAESLDHPLCSNGWPGPATARTDEWER